jgi:hypothetical protein
MKSPVSQSPFFLLRLNKSVDAILAISFVNFKSISGYLRLASASWKTGSSNRIFDCSAYSFLISKETQDRPRSSAAYPVVLLPAKGSNTRSPGSVKNSIKKAASSTGIRAGCGVTLRSRQVLEKKSFEFVLDILKTLGSRTSCFSSIGSISNRFGEMLPPRSFKNPLLLITCSDGLFPAL